MEHSIPVEMTDIGDMQAQVLSLYFSSDTSSLDMPDQNTLVLGGSFSISLSGKSSSQVAAAISRSSTGYSARVLFEVPDLGNLGANLSGETIDGGAIVKVNGHILKRLEETDLRLLPPYNDSRYDPWYPVVTNGWVTKTTAKGTWIYSLPEYQDQTWSTLYGKPYIDLEDIVPTRLGQKAFSLPRTPVYWNRNNVKVSINGALQSIDIVRDVDIYNGIVYLNRPVFEEEHILISYTYKEEGYIYEGIDLNPSEFHNPGILDRYILYYLFPYITTDGVVSNRTLGHVESSSILGAINLLPKTYPVLILGATQTRYLVDKSDIELVDTRSQGGGIKEESWDKALQRNREILGSTDYGFYDGVPYPGNMALFVTLPEEVKTSFERAEIEGIVKKFTAFGTYCFVEFE